VGLGSNQGDREAFLGRALRLLTEEGAVLEDLSSLYRSEPWRTGGPWFLNGVARLWVPWDPMGLLRCCEETERRLGREGKGDLAPRNVDLDILVYDDRVLRTEDLALPHPRLAERRFVLVPLAEIDPGLVIPGTGRTVSEMLASCTDCGDVRKLGIPG